MKIKNTISVSRVAAAVLALAMVLTLGACKKKNETDNADVNDNTSIVAKIGDESINMALYKAAFDSYAEYWTQLGFDPFTSKTDLENLQDVVLEGLLSDIAVLYHAKKEGITLTEEEHKAVEAEFGEAYASLESDYMTLAEEAQKKDPSLTVEQHYAKLIGELSAYYTGRVMSVDEYKAEYLKELINEVLIEKYKEKVVSEFNVSEEDVVEWYIKQVEVDKDLYTKTPEQFKEDAGFFEIYRGLRADAYPTTYAPEGYARLMDIIVLPEGTLSEDYSAKLAELTELGDECAALLFNDAINGNNDNRERIDELLVKYRALEKESNALYEEFIAPAKTKIEAAYAELESGIPFADVMLKYTENTYVIGESDYEGSTTFRTVGQLIAPEIDCGATDWSKTVKDIFSMTPEGKYSNIFTDEDGSLHIIYNCGKVQSGQIDIETIRGDIEYVLKNENGAKDWDELIKAWIADSAMEVNRESIRAVGADRLKTN